MREWLLELVVVLAYSKKTQWALFLGIFGFIAIHIWGAYLLSDFQLEGPMAGLTDVIKDKLLRRYDKAAWVCLVTFFLLAVKTYRRDKKRFYKW